MEENCSKHSNGFNRGGKRKSHSNKIYIKVLSVSCMFLRPKDSKNITNYTGTECVDSPVGVPDTNWDKNHAFSGDIWQQ